MDKKSKKVKTDYYRISIEYELKNISRAIHRLEFLRECRFADRKLENGSATQTIYYRTEVSYRNTDALFLNLVRLIANVEDALVDEMKMQANDNKNPLVS